MSNVKTYISDGIRMYKELTNDSVENIKVFSPTHNSDFAYCDIMAILKNIKKKKSKGLQLSSYTKLDYENIQNVKYYPSLLPQDKKSLFLHVTHESGIFKSEFNDGTILLTIVWPTYHIDSSSPTLQYLVVSTEENYKKYLRYIVTAGKFLRKPKNGIFQLKEDSYGNLLYDALVVPDGVIVHPQTDVMQTEINFYFNNVELYTRFNQSGVRKIMLISEPGSGKSSMFYKLANDFKSSHCIAFTQSIGSAVMHMNLCAQHNIRTIVFIDDVDTVFRNNNNTHTLNFLDGALTPRCTKGSVICMSTNYPESIEPRILSRPGRVDKIYNISPLEGEWALKCAALYFGEYFNTSSVAAELTSLVNGMTGAQIKELVQSSLSYAASSHQEITISLITKVKEDFANALKNAKEYAKTVALNKMSDSYLKTGFTIAQKNDSLT